METIYLSIQSSLTVTIIVGLFFIGLGYLNSKKTVNNRNYIIGNRDENTFTLTTSLAASALGAWILFGPASAATWGGLGAVLGYAFGAATPMLLLYNFGPKINKNYTVEELVKGMSLHWKKVKWKIEKNRSGYFESKLLQLNCHKAKKELNWQPKINFEQLVEMMVKKDLIRLESNG